jgi:hypothetical protein
MPAYQFISVLGHAKLNSKSDIFIGQQEGKISQERNFLGLRPTYQRGNKPGLPSAVPSFLSGNC